MNWQETKIVLGKLGIENLPEWQYRVDLRGADLRDADLVGANFSGVDLRDANFSGADLVDANFSGANLRAANFSGANLRAANFSGADLAYADLIDADSRGADFSGANFSGANLRGANFSTADLAAADLRGAKLPTYSKWIVTWRIDGIINIGCKSKSIAEWDEWFASRETFETERNTANFERIEAEYQHARRMIEIYQKYEASEVGNDRIK